MRRGSYICSETCITDGVVLSYSIGVSERGGGRGVNSKTENDRQMVR